MTGDHGGHHGELSAFIEIIRCNVAADPDDLELRVDLVTLLLVTWWAHGLAGRWLAAALE